MKGNTALKASLKVQLLANEVLIAESDDTALWQEILTSIQTGRSIKKIEDENPDSDTPDTSKGGSSGQGGPIKRFAADVGISEDEVFAACHPTGESPFITLDDHYWEMFKKNIPARGPKSVATIALPAALLSLWMKHARIESGPTIKQCKEVLATIHVEDKNVLRSIKNTEWLQRRGDMLIVNPTMRSKAISLVKAYCTRQGLDSKS